MYSIFESEIVIRPDDIDMNDHVHNTKYLDYVLAARYDQMQKDYKMSMGEFHKLDYNWIVKKDNGKTAAEGYLLYTMISKKTGKPVRIPDDIVEKYSI